ncbi:MAG TPA: hypothetical protein VN442_26935 [Bryobacteraceae bacterium]|nr:hypothetical protein [Bryobacteraceae bacterium]
MHRGPQWSSVGGPAGGSPHLSLSLLLRCLSLSPLRCLSLSLLLRCRKCRDT